MGLEKDRLFVGVLEVSDAYPMFMKPTILGSFRLSGFTWYIWLNTEIVIEQWLQINYSRLYIHRKRLNILFRIMIVIHSC